MIKHKLTQYGSSSEPVFISHHFLTSLTWDVEKFLPNLIGTSVT